MVATTAAMALVKLNSSTATTTTMYAKSTLVKPKNVVSSTDARQSSTLANYFTSVHSRLVRPSSTMTMIRKR